MSPGGGVRLLCGRFRTRLRKYATVGIVVYVADAVLVQRPSMRGFGGGRLGDQARVPYGVEQAVPMCLV